MIDDDRLIILIYIIISIHVGLCWIDDRCKVVCMKETVMAIASQLTQDPNTELLREKPRAFR